MVLWGHHKLERYLDQGQTLAMAQETPSETSSELGSVLRRFGARDLHLQTASAQLTRRFLGRAKTERKQVNQEKKNKKERKKPSALSVEWRDAWLFPLRHNVSMNICWNCHFLFFEGRYVWQVIWRWRLLLLTISSPLARMADLWVFRHL